MASKALYSEIIELVLNVDRYEKSVKEAEALLETFSTFATKRTTYDFKLNISEAVTAAKLMTEEFILIENKAKLANNAIKEVVDSTRRAASARDNAARIDLLGGKTDTQDFLTGQMAARRSMAQQAATESARARTAMALERAEMSTIIGQENLRLQLLKQQNAARDAAIRKTMGYKVGAFTTGARVGAGLDIAAGAGFALGGANLGGAIYMMERLAYATGIGQKSLGELAAKFGLVKLEGDGSAASIARFGSVLTGTLVAGGIVAGIAAIAFAGRALNKELAIMSTLLVPIGTSAEDLGKAIDRTANAAGRLSVSFGISKLEVVKGFYDALSTGIDGSQLEEFGRVAATVARGLNTSFQSAVNILTTLKDAYGAAVGDMGRYSDILFNAIDVGKFNVKDLQSNLGRVATTAAEAGVGIEDMMGALAAFNRAGLTTSQSVTSLMRYITSIIKPTNTAAAMFDKLGIAYGSAAFKGRTLAAQIDELRRATGGNIDIMSQLIGREQGRRGATIATGLPELMAETRSGIDAVGSATEAADRAMATFGDNSNKVWLTISNSVQQAGSDMLNVLNTVAYGSNLSADSMTEIQKTVDTLLLAINLVVAAISTVVLGIRGMIRATAGLAEAGSLFLTGQWRAAKEAWSRASDETDDYMSRITNTWSRLTASAADRINYANSALNDAVQTSGKNQGEYYKGIMERLEGTVITANANISKSMDTLAAVTQTTFQKMTSSADKYYRSLLERQHATEFFKTHNPASVSLSTTGMDALNEMSRIRGSYINNGMSGDPSKFNKTAKAAYNAAKKIYDAEFAAFQAAKAEAVAKLDKERLKAFATILAGAGLENGKESSIYTQTTKTDDKTHLDLQARLKELRDVAATIEAVTKDKTKSPEQILKDIQAAYVLMSDLKKKMYSAAGSLSEQDAYNIIDQLHAVDVKLDELKTKQHQRTIDGYKREYNAYYNVWRQKIALYDKEISKAEKLRDMSRDTTRGLRDYIDEIRRGSRGDDVAFKRRQLQADIEGRVSNIRNITDPKEQDKVIRETQKLIEEFRQAYTEEGQGRRAAAMAEEFARKLVEFSVTNENKQSKIIDDSKEGKRQATSGFDAATSDNPVAIAVRKEVLPIMQEALKVASEKGIGVNGDLNSKVIIERINVDLPKSDLIKMVQGEMEMFMKKHYFNQGAGRNDGTDDNNGPNGGDDTL